MKRETKKTIIACLFVFIISFFFFMYVYGISVDEVWTYGFAHNIANNLVPYRDFNMVITPLYPFLLSIPLRLIDNILIFHLGNALMITSIFYLLRKQDERLAFIIITMLIILYIFPTYNTLALFFVLLLIYLEKKEMKNDFLIGFILGLLILTKQSIGIVCLIPSLYYFYHEKKINLKRIGGLLVPLTVFGVGLILTNSLYACINDTLLGLAEFQEKNATYGIWFYLTLILFGFLIYCFVTKKEKRMSILLAMSFLITAYPLFDSSHFMIAVIPTIFVLGEGKLTNKKINTSILMITILITVLIRSVLICLNKDLTLEKESTKVLHYKFASSKYLEMIRDVKTNVMNRDGEVFIFNHQAYLIKLEADILLNRFDLINNGNMGKDGVNRYKEIITDHCSRNKCSFFISTTDLNGGDIGQTSRELLDYVVDNYKKMDTVWEFTIFTNED